MTEFLLKIFNALVSQITGLEKQNQRLYEALVNEMKQTVELRGILRETRNSINDLDQHLEKIGYYKANGKNGPFKKVKDAIQPSEKWL